MNEDTRKDIMSEWSHSAIDAAAHALCPLGSGVPACRCGGGCRRLAHRVLAAACEAELDVMRASVPEVSAE